MLILQVCKWQIWDKTGNGNARTFTQIEDGYAVFRLSYDELLQVKYVECQAVIILISNVDCYAVYGTKRIATFLCVKRLAQELKRVT